MFMMSCENRISEHDSMKEGSFSQEECHLRMQPCWWPIFFYLSIGKTAEIDTQKHCHARSGSYTYKLPRFTSIK